MLKWPASTLQVRLPKDKPGFVQFSAGTLRRRQVVKQVGANYYSAALLESEVEVKNVTMSLVSFPLGGKPRCSKARIVPMAFLNNIKLSPVRCGWAVKAKVNSPHCQAIFSFKQ